MTPNDILIYITFAFLAGVLVCWIINLITAKRGNQPSVWTTRFVYIFGLAAVGSNLVRMCMIYTDSRIIMIIASVIVLVSILIAFVRSEHANAEAE